MKMPSVGTAAQAAGEGLLVSAVNYVALKVQVCLARRIRSDPSPFLNPVGSLFSEKSAFAPTLH